MAKYTAEDALNLLKRTNLHLPENERPEFVGLFNKLYNSDHRYTDLVVTVGDIYCNILPFRDKNYKGKEFSEMTGRNKEFKRKVTKSGLAKEYEELVAEPAGYQTNF